jgi:hypothetical protein
MGSVQRWRKINEPLFPCVEERVWDRLPSVLPSGYRRSDYHYYGATDDDIESWGLDQPGAPAP